MCYKYFQRMNYVSPMYERCVRRISVINDRLYDVDNHLNLVTRQLPGAILADVEYADILESYAKNLCKQRAHLLKRKQRCENWYFHCFPLYDLLAPTENGASPR